MRVSLVFLVFALSALCFGVGGSQATAVGPQAAGLQLQVTISPPPSPCVQSVAAMHTDPHHASHPQSAHASSSSAQVRPRIATTPQQVDDWPLEAVLAMEPRLDAIRARIQKLIHRSANRNGNDRSNRRTTQQHEKRLSSQQFEAARATLLADQRASNAQHSLTATPQGESHQQLMHQRARVKSRIDALHKGIAAILHAPHNTMTSSSAQYISHDELSQHLASVHQALGSFYYASEDEYRLDKAAAAADAAAAAQASAAAHASGSPRAAGGASASRGPGAAAGGADNGAAATQSTTSGSASTTAHSNQDPIATSEAARARARETQSEAQDNDNFVPLELHRITHLLGQMTQITKSIQQMSVTETIRPQTRAAIRRAKQEKPAHAPDRHHNSDAEIMTRIVQQLPRVSTQSLMGLMRMMRNRVRLVERAALDEELKHAQPPAAATLDHEFAVPITPEWPYFSARRLQANFQMMNDIIQDFDDALHEAERRQVASSSQRHSTTTHAAAGSSSAPQAAGASGASPSQSHLQPPSRSRDTPASSRSTSVSGSRFAFSFGPRSRARANAAAAAASPVQASSAAAALAAQTHRIRSAASQIRQGDHVASRTAIEHSLQNAAESVQHHAPDIAAAPVTSTAASTSENANGDAAAIRAQRWQQLDFATVSELKRLRDSSRKTSVKVAFAEYRQRRAAAQAAAQASARADQMLPEWSNQAMIAFAQHFVPLLQHMKSHAMIQEDQQRRQTQWLEVDRPSSLRQQRPTSFQATHADVWLAYINRGQMLPDDLMNSAMLNRKNRIGKLYRRHLARCETEVEAQFSRPTAAGGAHTQSTLSHQSTSSAAVATPACSHNEWSAHAAYEFIVNDRPLPIEMWHLQSSDPTESSPRFQPRPRRNREASHRSHLATRSRADQRLAELHAEQASIMARSLEQTEAYYAVHPPPAAV